MDFFFHCEEFPTSFFMDFHLECWSPNLFFYGFYLIFIPKTPKFWELWAIPPCFSGNFALGAAFFTFLEWKFWDFPSFFLLGAEGGSKISFFSPFGSRFFPFFPFISCSWSVSLKWDGISCLGKWEFPLDLGNLGTIKNVLVFFFFHGFCWLEGNLGFWDVLEVKIWDDGWKILKLWMKTFQNMGIWWKLWLKTPKIMEFIEVMDENSPNYGNFVEMMDKNTWNYGNYG